MNPVMVDSPQGNIHPYRSAQIVLVSKMLLQQKGFSIFRESWNKHPIQNGCELRQ